MPDVSNTLKLPFLQASQADKHVSVNEALALLDVLVGQSVIASLANPPTLSPSEGDCYLIAPTATGAWQGKGNQLAVWRTGDWWFLPPQRGWQVRDQSKGDAARVFNGLAWVAPSTSSGTMDQIEQFGLASSPTSTTPFSALLNEASWTARSTTQAGNGDLRIYARKQATSNVVSSVFQNGFSGRAEVGLCGDDAYSIKVSPDGSTWQTAVRIDPANFKVSFPTGLVSVNGVDLGRGGGQVATNVALGGGALGINTSGNECTAIGHLALASNLGGSQNTAIGRYALGTNSSGSFNVGVGQVALFFNTSGANNTAIGQGALYANSVGNENTATGHAALSSNTTGSQNTAVGLFALYGNLTGDKNTAVGRYAMSTGSGFSNCTALGHNAQVTASNQIQLGDSLTTTYVYGTVQTRSDLRDKTDIRETAFGLDFIRALRPVDFRWNYREDYRSKQDSPPKSRQEKATKHQRKRFHSGFLAQDVQAVLRDLGQDFGGLQDHKIGGGQDVFTLGYDEFIAPLVRAVQELADRLDTLTRPL
jgi:hypothetical protein